jgi:hypothetical protein
LRVCTPHDVGGRNAGRDARRKFASRQFHFNPPWNRASLPALIDMSWLAPAKARRTPPATYELLHRE